MAKNENWFSIINIDELDSPALVVYPARVRQNIRTAIDMIGDPQRLRPHVKTNKSADVTRLMIASGISKFKCATIAEAEMLGTCNAADVLLAYQPIGPKLSRFVALIKKYPATNFSCLTDNISAATQMAAAFESNKITVPVYIDINVGQNRTGIAAGNEAMQLYIDCAQLKGMRPIGLHAYDGHIRDIDWNTRKKKCDEAFLPVEQMKQDIMHKGLQEPVIIAGGSPTFSIHCKRENVECSPGTFVYWDKGYSDLCPEQRFLPAALVITRVISFPEKTKICLDLGHKSIAAENELSQRVYFINVSILKFIGQSEEHLVVETNSDHPYKIGDTLYGMPVHICPTVALYERVYTVEDNEVKGEWKTVARDRKISV